MIYGATLKRGRSGRLVLEVDKGACAEGETIRDYVSGSVLRVTGLGRPFQARTYRLAETDEMLGQDFVRAGQGATQYAYVEMVEE